MKRITFHSTSGKFLDSEAKFIFDLGLAVNQYGLHLKFGFFGVYISFERNLNAQN